MTKKGQARIHREFYEMGTKRHDGLVAKIVTEETLKAIRLMGVDSLELKRSWWDEEIELCIDKDIHKIVKWVLCASQPVYELEVECKASKHSSFTLGWADIRVFFDYSHRAEYVSPDGELKRVKNYRVKDKGMTLNEYIKSSANYEMVWGEVHKGEMIHQGYRGSRCSIVVDAKPEIKSATSIIRQIKQYRESLNADLAIIATYDEVEEEIVSLFNNEEIKILQFDEDSGSRQSLLEEV